MDQVSFGCTALKHVAMHFCGFWDGNGKGGFETWAKVASMHIENQKLPQSPVRELTLVLQRLQYLFKKLGAHGNWH